LESKEHCCTCQELRTGVPCPIDGRKRYCEIHHNVRAYVAYAPIDVDDGEIITEWEELHE